MGFDYLCSRSTKLSLLSFLESFELSFVQWSLVICCGLLWGLSKAGLKGVSMVAVPIMAYVFGGKASTGIVLPMLIMADVLAVVYYHRHADWSILVRILPWTMIGVLLAVWLGDQMQEQTFQDVMAVLIILSVLLLIWWDRKKVKNVPSVWWFSALMGIIAGFTTMIGNLAGAIASIYFLTMRLPKDNFIGTNAWFFFIINLFKFPMHIFFWHTISWRSLGFNLSLFPALLVGFILGVFVIGKMSDKLYRQLVLVMTAIAGLVLLFR